MATAVAVTAAGAAAGVAYYFTAHGSKCAKTEKGVQTSVIASTEQFVAQHTRYEVAVTQLQAEFILAGFTAPESFIHLAPITASDKGWRNCMDPIWTVDAFPMQTARAIPVYDLADKKNFERYLRSIYCTDVRNGRFFEIASMPLPFEVDSGEPADCLKTPNLVKLMQSSQENQSNLEYYYNFNSWLDQFQEKVKSCAQIKTSWPTQLDVAVASYPNEMIKARVMLWQTIGALKGSGVKEVDDHALLLGSGQALDFISANNYKQLLLYAPDHED